MSKSKNPPAAKKKKHIKKKQILLWVLLSALGLLLLGVLILYAYAFKPVVQLDGRDHKYVYIRTGSTLDEVMNTLVADSVITNTGTFKAMAQQLHYTNNIKPGKYKVENGMSNKQLISLLRSGKQAPVNLVVRSRMTAPQIASLIGRNLEADSTVVLNLLEDSTYLALLGFRTNNITNLFNPNTYQFFWDTGAKDVFSRMNREYKRFWDGARAEKAGQLNMTPDQVYTLASIVEKETNKVDEMPVVAGVYYNRLQRGMLLQADPTVIYAVGNPDIRRVLNIHLQFNSPYNTYLYKGLPPGPICLPSTQAVDAVLNRKVHDYLFFCAKEDFSGYHNFACDQAQHDLNARRYRMALGKAGIYK